MYIEIASSRLEHADWLQHYYPDDLPKEWRLSYYSNEFLSLLVPVIVWTKDDYPDLESWLEDVPERFRFSFKLSSNLFESEAWGTIERNLLSCHRQTEALLLVSGFPQEKLSAEMRSRFKFYEELMSMQIETIALKFWENKESDSDCIVCAKMTEASALALRHLFEKLISFATKRQKNVLLYLDAPWSVVSNLRMMKPLFGV